MTVGKDGKMQNIANPLSVGEIYNTLDKMQDGSIVQLYWDTNHDFGPNHYSLIMKIDGKWYNFNNNDARGQDGKVLPITFVLPKPDEPRQDRPVYGIYYNSSDYADGDPERNFR
ncbi:hypothetical protein EHO60_13740 [Leptospira fletcheri]|uniref:Uncharacterized protein n=2 Tax=Leptospira fletcheri TaxID=2484981 RepID=A0A4R9GBJ4_9LEPT|nr:hypothetical protein EHO60_13740 [Leptospira fletcheri]